MKYSDVTAKSPAPSTPHGVESKAASMELSLADQALEQQLLRLVARLAVTLPEVTDVVAVHHLVVQQVQLYSQCSYCAIFPVDERVLLSATALSGLVPPSRQLMPLLQQSLQRQTMVMRTLPSAELLVAIPVQHQDRCLAILVFSTHAVRQQLVRQKQILQDVSCILAHHLYNLRNLTQLQDSIARLAHAERVQRVLFAIASLSYDPHDLRTFYQRIHQSVAELLYAKNFYIALYDEQSAELRFPYFVDEFDVISPDEVLPDELLNHSLTGYVFRHNRLVLATPAFLREHTDEIRLYGNEPESWLGVPFHSGEVRGVVVVQSYDHRFCYSPQDVEVLTFVSQHLSSALERVFAEQRMRHQAMHDALTNLPNRLLFLDRVQHALHRRLRHPELVLAVLYLDLDRFKKVNDTLGHHTGDEFLIQVAAELRGCLRQHDTLARLGGDEFAILMVDVTDASAVFQVAERIISQLQQPFQLQRRSLKTGTSIGIAFAEQGVQLNAEELIRRADIAMYQAKNAGRGQYKIFTDEMDAVTHQYYQLEHEINKALQTHEFIAYYQPIIKLDTGQLVGFEALIRWLHPERGFVSPAQFIPVAETLDLHYAIDCYMLSRVCQRLARWAPNAPLYISVNVSAKSFAEAGFVATVLGLLQQYNVPAQQLAIEITETALIQRIDEARVSVQQLRHAGIKVLLDDFGTGYSSLSYLHEFNVDVLKIDRSFIANIQSTDNSKAVVKTVIALAQTLQLQVVAEGIETEQQLQWLAEQGCHCGQGYWISPPIPAAEAEQWLQSAPFEVQNAL